MEKRKTLFYPNFVWEQNYYRMLGSVLHRFGIKSEEGRWYFLLVALYYCKISSFVLWKSPTDSDFIYHWHFFRNYKIFEIDTFFENTFEIDTFFENTFEIDTFFENTFEI